MFFHSLKKNLLLLFFVTLFFTKFVSAQVSLTVKPMLHEKGIVIPKDYSGIAYEISEVTPANGKYYFGPHNMPLINMIKTLGITTIRIGGNTADLTTFPFPTEEDVDSLFQFAKRAGVKIIYTFRLRYGVVKDNVSLASYIWKNYRTEVYAFAIGNEPDLFPNITYETYAKQWKTFYDSIRLAAPGVPFCGPNITGGATQWMAKFVRDFGNNDDIKFLTVHDYPGGSGPGVKDAAKAIDDMLSERWIENYEKFYNAFLPLQPQRKLRYRNEEINSFYGGGALHVSNTFASALWSLEYLYWWAEHGFSGINFQNGDSVARGTVLTNCKYAAFVTDSSGYYARPSAYGIKAFSIGSSGKLIPVDVTNKGKNKSDSINLKAYSVIADDGLLYITLLNKEHGEGGKAADIMIDAGDDKYRFAEVMYLQAPADDVTSEKGITLGNSSITNNGTWNGKWMNVKAKNKQFTLHLSKSTAAVVKLLK